MNKYISIVVAVLFGITPAFALADQGDGHGGPPVPPPLGISAHGDIQVGLQIHGGDEGQGDASSSVDVNMDEDMQASSTPWMNGEKEGLLKHLATTTPPGIFRHGEGSSTPEGSSTEDRGPMAGFVHANSHVGLFSFFNWLFNLPASTTVGQIEAGAAASSSASTQASSSAPVPPPPGLNFLQRIFAFFHFGSQ